MGLFLNLTLWRITDMSNATPTEPDRTPTFREIDMSAEIRKIWGKKWNAPELVYEFSNDRKFYERTEEGGAYRRP